MPTENPRVAAEGSAALRSTSDRVCPVCAYKSEVAGEQFCPRDGAYLVDSNDLRAAENDPLLGRRISEFAVVARVGTGGMGTVYRALQIGMDRPVALKVLRAELTDDPQVLQRFLQEAKATARLQHRNLAITYTSGSTPDGLFYIAMEYIPGGSLTQLIEKSWTSGENGPTYGLEMSRIMRLFSQIVAALAHAHRLGIVHRDLKPDNVLLQVDDDEGEQAKIVDFGIAKILASPDGKNGLIKTDAHTNLGTALYMAPERFGGAPGDPRLDVYALGLLLHELVTGLLPFANRYEDRETPTVLLHKRLTMAIPPLASPQPLSPQLVMLHADLLDRDPMRRPAHAGEVRQRLRDIPEAANLHISLDLGAKVTPSSPENRAVDSSILPLDKYMAAGEKALPTSGQSLSGVRRSLPPVGRSLPPVGRSIPPVGRSIPPVGRSLPPVGRSLPPTNRSLSPVGSTETSPQYANSGRSLPPPTSGTSLGSGAGSSSDGYARFTGAINPDAAGHPMNNSLPPGGMSLPPGAVSIPPGAMSMHSKSEGLLLDSMRSLNSGGTAPAPLGSAVTKWLLAGCLVLIVLLILLALS